MRRFDESEKHKFEQRIKLGEDNAECIRQMERWCKHVEIKRVTEGLYAQVTGLPIASHSIGCQYVQGGLQGMDLRWIFSDFLVQHCSACTHHSPNGNTAWADKIIHDYQKESQKHQEAAGEEADRISRLRSDLRLRFRDMSAEAQPEAYRILEFLQAVFSDNEAERSEACERLKQSARIGPDLFPGDAIELLLSLAVSLEFSRSILPVCEELARKRSDLRMELYKAALGNIEKGLQPELSASALEALGAVVTYPLGEICIERLLLSQNHFRPFGGWENAGTDYSHSTAVLVRSFDADPESVQKIIRRALQNENDYVRVQACGAMRLIQQTCPQIAVNMLADLIQSLKLYEGERAGTTPSGQITQMLEQAFRHCHGSVDQFLAESMPRVRPTVQEDIIRVYRDQFFDRSVTWEERRLQRKRTEVSEAEKVAIERLLGWIKDDQLEIDIRTGALEALEMACSYAAPGVLGRFDSLLGYYAIISAQENPPDAPPEIVPPNYRQDPQLERMNQFRRRQQWGILKQRLQNCLQELCKASPSEVFDSICGCLDQPLEHIEEGFKGCCVHLLGELGKDYLLRPRVLPLIWRTLMDYGSAWVRAKAIHAAVEMFSYSHIAPPANLADTIIIHLQDERVVVHQAAVWVVSRCPDWFDARQSVEILNCLAAHLRVYKEDKYQLDHICEGILRIGRKNETFKPFALRMIESVFPTGEELVDAKIAEDLMWFCGPIDRIASFVAKDIANFLGRYGGDRFNDYRYSRRFRMFQWLHELPAETYQRVAKELLASAKEMAKRDAWESFHFASLFAHFRAFQYEQDVLETAANTLPEEPRHEPSRTRIKQLMIIAAGNAALQAGNPEKAETWFTTGMGGV
jgi:hypothetical protein